MRSFFEPEGWVSAEFFGKPPSSCAQRRISSVLAARFFAALRMTGGSECQLSSGRQSQGQIEERDEVERVVMEHRVHVAFEAGADVVSVHGRDAVAGDVVGAMAAADVLFERLQSAVGQLLSPASAGVVEDVDVNEIVRRGGE
jgi:hypothetical protein